MADSMQFDLVAPERKLASVEEAIEVMVPGADGDLTVMPGHAPMLTTLRPGKLTLVTRTETYSYAVTGGFAEITPEGVTVLAERSLPAEEFTKEVHDHLIEEARRVHEEAHPSVADLTAKLLADMEAMGTHMTL
ncbi:ATP synthase F0F1 subunit epsilon [Thioclava dalianensis]|uniref:ATP synthase epsilon chain n=1 Tax=Thioclava dalianensis TaxID=1185766 RepID=A0A074TH27_9RHOB|nr:F0F1 ATP synthase subunit epsilon [Thioclava dalianensis]KEP71016.1 ATP synthase F0F1 subunit epsilon [Thioclava dalianensis]SFN26844.1 F-type H+-transporting ATPase subunit epsilon [Thioclava dalianensis]